LPTIDEFDPIFLTELVGHIYEAAVDPQHWDEFLNILERIYPGSRVTLFGHENGRPCEAMTLYKNFSPDDLRAYVDYFVTNSPYIARGKTLPVGRPTHYEAFVDERMLKATEHYNDYVRPRRLGYWGTGLVVERRPERATALSLADHKNDPDRRSRQLRLLETLAPHLLRAFRLHRTIATQKATGDAAKAAFDRWAYAALVVSSSGRVVTMNRSAEMLLASADALSLGRDGKLRSIDETRTGELDVAIRKCAALASAIDPHARPSELDGVVLPRRSGGAPLRAMLAPLPFLGGVATSEMGAGTVLLVIFDPDNVQRTPIDWMARQFGLTPSEQRLTEAIVNGVPLADAAEQLGIRLSTARTRLKTIQTKTHSHRQVDLVRLALSIPTIRPA
jgi:DNA-binding CsgD family transcriptional regulator